MKCWLEAKGKKNTGYCVHVVRDTAGSTAAENDGSAQGNGDLGDCQQSAFAPEKA